MCDAELIGKNIIDGDLKIYISENYYGKKEIMEYADTTNKKKSERSYIGGGTFQLIQCQ